MAQLYDSHGNALTLGKELGRGGEGSVFVVRELNEQVAKIYHEPVSAHKAEKLRQMVELKTDKLVRLAAWVTDVLRDERGETIGFLMPRLSFGTQIHELYNPASRRRRFPEADWRFLIHAAANIARAFAVVHAHGHVIGDVNHGNIVIARDATVRLIDCDSYHLNAPDRSFLCEVGVSTHTPPELQGKSLREIPRTDNHDNFGLAVLIFQLLFMGRHPFSGKFLGAGENTLENSIRAGRFAYGDDASTREMSQPPGTLPLAAVSPAIAGLFRRAFLEIENRPAPREWIEALETLEQNLLECSFNRAHYFYGELAECPWCELEAETGVSFFPTHFNENFAVDPSADLVTIGRLIDVIKPPDVPAQLPARISPGAQPSPIVSESLSRFRRNLAIYLTTLGLSIVLLVAFVGSGIFTIAIAFYYICSVVIKSLTKKAQTEAEALFDSAKSNLEKFEDDWKKLVSKNIFTDARTQLKKSVTEFKNLPAARAAKLKELENEHRARQLDFYLKGFPLRRAAIKNLTETQIRELVKVQIVSADDVTDANFRRLPYFNQLYKNRLFAWRAELEKNFVFRLPPQIKNQIEEKVEAEFAEKQGQLEIEIKEGLPGLQRLSLEISNNYQSLLAKSEQINKEFVSAQIDLERVADLKTKAVGWSLGVACVSLLVAVPVRQVVYNVPASKSSPLATKTVYGDAKKRVGNFVDGGIGGSSDSAVSTPLTDNYYLEDGTRITLETWGKAFEFYRDGIQQMSAGDYNKAAKSFQKAVNLKPDVSDLRLRLGESFFQQAKYQLAIVSLNDALQINPNNSGAYHLLGESYNKLPRRADAIKSFKKAVEADSNAALSYYELGATLRADKKPNEAINYLNEALKNQPELYDARFELALCYDEVGFRDLALKEYNKLEFNDSVLAKELAGKLGIKNGY